jgi:hypothetical protein
MKKWNRWLAFTVLVILAIAGVVAVLYGTAAGTHISPDSASYIGAARSLLAGRGLTTNGRDWTPLTHYPPLFSVLVALGGLFGPDPVVVARWLNAFLMGGSIFLVGWLLHRGGRGAPWTAVLGGALVLASSDVLFCHVWAWSEPLMIFCGLAGFLGLSLYLEEGRRLHLFAGAAGMALALLARYAAMPMVAAAVLGILLFRPARFRERLRDTFLFLLVSAGPLLLWMVRNHFTAGNATNRQFIVHWIGSRNFGAARNTCVDWILVNPLHVPANQLVTAQMKILYAALGVLLLLVALLIWKTWRPNRDATNQTFPPRMPWVLLIFSVGYVAFLILSISFYDANTPLDARILAPLHVILIAFTLGALHAAFAGGRVLRWFGAVLLLGGIVFAGAHRKAIQKTLQDYHPIHTASQGYDSGHWRNYKFFERIRAMPDIPIYCNDPGPTYFHTDRLIYSPPSNTNHVTTLSNPYYELQRQQMREDLVKRRGVYIRMFPGNGPPENSAEAAMIREFGLKSILKNPEAEVYEFRPPPPPIERIGPGFIPYRRVD